MTRINKQSRETIPMLKIFKWFATFAGHILLYSLIVNFVFGYRIHLLPDEEGYYTQSVRCRKGYKIYAIEYKEDDDIQPWVEKLKYWGYIKD